MLAEQNKGLARGTGGVPGDTSGSGQVLLPGEGKSLPLLGAAIVFKASGARRAGAHDVAEYSAEPGSPGPGPHVHRTHEELFYLFEGEFGFLVGDQTVRLGPGSFVCVPPGVVHDFKNAGSVTARMVVIAWPGGLDHYFEEKAALLASGALPEEAIRDLRLKYDIDEVDVRWSV